VGAAFQPRNTRILKIAAGKPRSHK